MRRLVVTSATTLITFALLASTALAEDHGQGTYGEITDKNITNAGFMVIAFFPLLVLVLSIVQWKLDSRKARRKAAAFESEVAFVDLRLRLSRQMPLDRIDEGSLPNTRRMDLVRPRNMRDLFVAERHQVLDGLIGLTMWVLAALLARHVLAGF